MRKDILFSLAALSIAAMSQGAAAGPAYRASDIVSRFAPATDLGSSRALCIGTDSECAKAVAPKPPRDFDLTVNFEYNSATLTKPARENLDEFAKALKDPRLSSSGFVVGGYTDAKGSPAYNLDLSSRRAAAVVDYLQGQGIEPARLEPRGYGERNPVAKDPLDPANRRVETRLRTE